MESAKGYSKTFWERLRQELLAQKESNGSWDQLGKLIDVKGNTLLSFALGRSKGLSQETLDKMSIIGIDIARLVEETTPRKVEPMQTWQGETKSVSEASKDKGYGEGTIRKYCKAGKLDYVQNGRKIAVVVNAKYEALPETEKAKLRKEVARLTEENTALKKEIEEIKSGQQTFAFMDDANQYTRTLSSGHTVGIFEQVAPILKIPYLPAQTSWGDVPPDHCLGLRHIQITK